MKKQKFYLAGAIVIACVSIAAAQDGRFDGLDKVMDRDTYQRSGLEKLTPGERKTLDGFLRNYLAQKQKDAAAVAAAQAVDRAVKERKVRPPEIIESRMVGIYKGYGPRTVFHLANGETWKPTNADVVSNSAIESPNVVIYRDLFGYKMFIEGASIVRVMRVK